jgi:hypothetical protein
MMTTYTFELDPTTLTTDAGRASWITSAMTTCGRELDLWFTPISEDYEVAKATRLAIRAGDFHGAQVYRGHNRRVAVSGTSLTLHTD